MANEIAYGFIGLQDLFSQRVSEIGVQRVFDAVQESMMTYNDIWMGIMGTMVEQTTVPKEQIEIAGSGTLQPIDMETGNARPVQDIDSYAVAYPLQAGADAWGTNRITEGMLTVEEANRLTLNAQRRDYDWNIRHFLASVFDSTAWTYTDRYGNGTPGAKGLGSISIQPLANADTVQYNRIGGAAKATDTHYLAQANNISDSDNPFPTIREEIQEHPSNSGPILCLIPQNLRDEIEGLSTFIEVNDPNVRYGIATDTLSGMVNPGPGQLLGYIKGEDTFIAEWRSLPDSYLIAVSTGAGPFVKMRQLAQTDKQGLFMENFSPQNGFKQTQMIRIAGYGVYKRVAALVMRIGNASYAVPSGYDAPLAV